MNDCYITFDRVVTVACSSVLDISDNLVNKLNKELREEYPSPKVTLTKNDIVEIVTRKPNKAACTIVSRPSEPLSCVIVNDFVMDRIKEILYDREVPEEKLEEVSAEFAVFSNHNDCLFYEPRH